MAKLSRDQLKVTAEILGNTSVAWFSIGVISPLFLGTVDLKNRAMAFGMVMALVFATIAIIIVGKKQND